MAQDLNTAFQANSVDIVARTEANTNGNNNSVYPKLVLTLGTSGTGITITEVAADAAGQTFQQGTAMPLTAAASTDTTLTLTRADGGDILLTGAGAFVNTNGIVSSSAGSPALLVMIEDEEGAGEVETGVRFKEEFTPNVTANDEDSTGGTITYTPFADSDVVVKVNGLSIDIGDGNKGEACYFSADGGTTPKAIADIEAGDTLYWMGSVAGYQLESSDEIDLLYEKSSND